MRACPRRTSPFGTMTTEHVDQPADEATDPSSSPNGTQLEFEGGVTVNAPQAELWERLSDPAFLAECVPGAESIDQRNEREYSVSVSRGISRLTISITGDVEIVDMEEPDWMLVEGRAYDSRTHSDFTGTAALEMSSMDGERTELSYKAYLTFSGGTAVLTSKLLRSIVESDVETYFENIHTLMVEDRSV